MREARIKSFRTFLTVLAAGAVATIANAAHATTTFSSSLVDPGFYNGSGGVDAGFTVESPGNGVELGLSAILRGIGAITPTNNVYNVPLGVASGAAKWNFNYSVNLQAFSGNAGLTLSQVTPNISILNVANGRSINFNPISLSGPIFDNAGWDGISENLAILNLGTDFSFQNSENLSFGFVSGLNPLFAFDPNLDDTYIITLSLFGPDSANLGSVTEVVVAGAGSTATPLPAALPLFASGAGLLGFIARRRKSKNKAAGALA